MVDQDDLELHVLEASPRLIHEVLSSLAEAFSEPPNRFTAGTGQQATRNTDFVGCAFSTPRRYVRVDVVEHLVKLVRISLPEQDVTSIRCPPSYLATFPR